ncbi:hypothetical protein PC116_g24983 [Phytophthora cactorum]|nr:hypothetical protein Pcac1_g7541 [Phytophthora cactorum]KAG4226619.1 hypothetical protein PC116_g24983 [Phytophthora cactorum]
MHTNRRKIAKIEGKLPAHYFTMAHHRWKESTSWPPN